MIPTILHSGKDKTTETVVVTGCGEGGMNRGILGH